jgi:hypothetical protein
MRIKSVAALGLCLLASACATSWEPVYGPVPQTAEAQQGRKVRLMMKEGGLPVEMQYLRVEGDSLVGFTGEPPQRLAVAVEDVQLILVRQADADAPVNTAIKTTGVVLVALIVASIVAMIAFMDVVDDL